MCGSSGGFWRDPRPIQDIKQDFDEQNNEFDYNSTIEEIIKDSLKLANQRDTEAINKHLEELKKALSKNIDDFVEMRFGGSVAKHSYVNGLSDVDVLVNISQTELSSELPQTLLKRFAKLIKERLPNTEINIGNMSIIVKYSDKTELQLLPSLKTKTGVKVPSADGLGWSSVVKPHLFARKLTEINGKCGGNLVPVIKLFKICQKSLPEDNQLSGYHIESLAVNAFRKYSGNLNKKEMFKYFCEYISKNITTPIVDSTGQSIHVDDKLGSKNSNVRKTIQKSINRLYRKVNTADLMKNANIWKEIFD